MQYSYFEKLARSYDAKRKKQYRHMLKRMYGSDEAMIEAIRNSGDANIYHGTSDLSAKKSILTEGAKADKNTASAFGQGTYFADKDRALQYTKKSPSADATQDGLIRLKRPSELKGTKVTYGNIGDYQKVTADKVESKLGDNLRLDKMRGANPNDIEKKKQEILNGTGSKNKLQSYGELDGKNLITDHMGKNQKNQLIGTKDIDSRVLTSVTDKGVEGLQRPELPKVDTAKWEAKQQAKMKKPTPTVEGVKEQIKENAKKMETNPGGLGGNTPPPNPKVDNIKQGIKSRAFNLGTKGKVGLGLTLGAAAIGGGLAYNNYRKNKQQKY